MTFIDHTEGIPQSDPCEMQPQHIIFEHLQEEIIGGLQQSETLVPTSMMFAYTANEWIVNKAAFDKALTSLVKAGKVWINHGSIPLKAM